MNIKNNIKKISEEKKPLFHLFPLYGYLNDPNGIWYNEKKKRLEIYYQWNPNYFINGKSPKSWGTYHLYDDGKLKAGKALIEPKEFYNRMGCYSGSHSTKKGDEDIYYYTANNIVNNIRESNIYSFNSLTKKQVRIIEHNTLLFSQHFRDPFHYMENGKEYIAIAAQRKDKKPSIAIYKKEEEWVLNKIIKNDKIALGENWECPNNIVSNGERFWLFSVENALLNNDYDHTVIFTNSKINNKQILDYGLDFYAPLLYKKNNKDMMMAWVGSLAEDKHAIENGFSGYLTIQREITIKDDVLYQNIPEDFKNKFEDVPKTEIKNNFYFESNNLDSPIIFTGNNGEFSIYNNDTDGVFLVSDVDMISNKYNDIQLSPKRIAPKIKNIEILYDNGVFEIFVNNGEYTFTQRIFLGDIKNISGDVKNIKIYKGDVHE